MSWRPKGLVNPYHDTGDQWEYCERHMRDCFEATIDAVLEALKAPYKAIEVTGAKMVLTDESGERLLELPLGWKGWLVPIPNDEEEEKDG